MAVTWLGRGGGLTPTTWLIVALANLPFIAAAVVITNVRRRIEKRRLAANR